MVGFNGGLFLLANSKVVEYEQLGPALRSKTHKWIQNVKSEYYSLFENIPPRQKFNPNLQRDSRAVK